MFMGYLFIYFCSGFLGRDDQPSNGLAVTPEHISDEDDKSSHASSSDWTPQPQIGSFTGDQLEMVIVVCVCVSLK